MNQKIGITGESGFIGSFLRLKLKLQDSMQVLPFADEYFDDDNHFQQWVKMCDVIIHLAAINRTTGDPEDIYTTNLRLVQKLIDALRSHPGKPHVLFASSIHEGNNSPYGRSKRVGRELLAEWAKKTGGSFSGLVIPNVYGPFSSPFYNSVVATFCYQLTHGETPCIEKDAEIPFIHVWDLAEGMYSCIMNRTTGQEIRIPESFRMSVSRLLDRLSHFHRVYAANGSIPVLGDKIDISLFNTLRSFYDSSMFPIYPTRYEDSRGYLFELVKAGIGGQVFFSVTKPGITRGNHFHTRKIERFCVVDGEAVIRIRRMGKSFITEYHVSGSEPGIVDIPVFCTHSITNVGSENLITLFWSNEIFNPSDPDTYHESVLEESQ